VTPGRLFAARALSARDAVTQMKRHFLPIYIGPILVIGLGAPRIANLARAQNVTTVAISFPPAMENLNPSPRSPRRPDRLPSKRIVP
jgi:hypothetical protein